MDWVVEQDDVVLGAEKRELRLAVAELSKWAMGLGWWRWRWWLLCADSVGEAMEV